MRRGLITLVFLAALIPAAAFTSFGSIFGDWFSIGPRSDARTLEETLHLLSKHVVKAADIESSEQSGDAIDLLLRSLDENSEYLPHQEAADFEIETEQRYGGIGVEVEETDKRVTIVSPFADSPGELAGLLPGDQIVRIEGESVDGIPYRKVIDQLRGPAGSQVKFSIFRPSTGKVLTLEVIRQIIRVDSVRDAGMLEPGVGYIRITQFGTQTYREFIGALEKLENQGLKGLILDLRNNPGGVLSSAVEIAGEFFEKGETVVYTRSRETAHDKLYLADTPLRDVNYPIVILVNGGSASASEIVAGALQDIGRAKLVGARTFGKGSVQTIFQYRNGDAMRLTTAMFFTPGGRIIHKQGIAPDVVVELSEEDLSKLMFQRRYLDALGEEAFVEKYGFDPILDKQLEVAMQVVRERSLL